MKMSKIKKLSMFFIITSVFLIWSTKESYSQDSKDNQNKRFNYLGIQLGGFEDWYSSSYIGVGYRTKLIKNLGIEFNVGNYFSDSELIELKNQSSVPDNFKFQGFTPYDGSFLSGFGYGYNINYLISGPNYGIIPKFGWNVLNVSYLNFTRKGNGLLEGEIDTERKTLPSVGVDFYYKKFVIGSTYTIFPKTSSVFGLIENERLYSINFNLGFVINNKIKE
jgi:hypothetical protein